MKTSRTSKITEYIVNNESKAQKVISEIISSIQNESPQLRHLANRLNSSATTSEALYELNEIYKTTKGKEIIKKIYSRQKTQEHRDKQKLKKQKTIQIELDNETIKILECESRKKKKRPNKIASETLSRHLKSKKSIAQVAEDKILLERARTYSEQKITDSLLEALEACLREIIKLESKQVQNNTKEPLGSAYIKEKIEYIRAQIAIARNKLRSGLARPIQRPLK